MFEAARRYHAYMGKSIKIDGCTFYLHTEHTDPAGFIRGPILAAAISTKFLNRTLKNSQATDVVFVPWTPEEP